MISCKNNHGQIVTLPKEKFVFRPSVYGLVRNLGRICVCKMKSNGQLWFPGGGVEVGESMELALLREIDEETGLKNVQIGRLLGSFENFFYYEPRDLAMHAFLFFYDCSTEEQAMKTNDQIDDIEAMDFAWVEAKQINKDDLADLNEEIFGLLQNLS